jgi:UDP-N-acetylmuramoyl-tripeptide--D-alanyl-D-alanine ligase
MKLWLSRIAEWAEGKLLFAGDAETAATGYSIDSRTIAVGEVFFAVSGERYDAHDFVGKAFAHGAVAAVIAKPEKLDAITRAEAALILVDDPLRALQRLAARVRAHWVGLGAGRRVIGITGSAGKTTTKEAVAAVLATKYRVLKSQGNLNNEFGVPLQLLRLQQEDEVAVIEMGMSHAGEIAALARIAAPQWGVVTNVGNAHAENFPDGIEGIARAKHELIAGLAEGGVAFLNCDDPRVAVYDARASRVVFYGRCEGAAVRAVQVEELGEAGLRILVTAAADLASAPDGAPSAGGQSAEVRLQLLGAHNVTNALAAVAVGLAAGVPLEQAAAALATLAPGDKRGEVLELRGARVINDCYNSNPEALRSMIRTLAGIPAKRRILVAGEMLELGPEAAALHAACGRAAAEAGFDYIVGVRGLARHLVDAALGCGAAALFLETPEEAGAWLAAELRPGDAVLLKASRGVRLERVLLALS